MRITALFVFSALFSAHAVLAEGGRLPDGTAYRIDSQGLQIKDHIAELEVTIAELRREVGLLQDELKSTNKKPVVSSDLLKAATPRTGDSDISNTMVKNQLSSCQLSSAKLQEETSRLREEKLELSKSLDKRKSDVVFLHAKLKQTQKQLQEAGTRLYETSDKLDTENVSIREQLIALRNENKSLAKQLEDKTLHLSSFQEKLKSTQQKLASAESELVSTESQLESLEDELSRKPVVVAKETQPKVTQPRARLGSTSPTFANKSELNAEFNKIRGLIQQRKSLLDRALVRNPGARRYVSPLESLNGTSLDRLRSMRLQPQVSSQVIEELRQIQDVLAADISKLSSL